MPGIASAATAVLIAHVGGGTSRIRVGAGGIMLPNHAPLQVAEQFGTLESLFPGRIDLGLGPRARHRPGGGDGAAPHARTDPDAFPDDVLELLAYLREPQPGQRGAAPCPAPACDVPIWILGSSLFGAQVAAALGLPFAFASHFAPAMLRRGDRDSTASASRRRRSWPRPYVMLGVNVVAADTDDEARFLASSGRQSFASLRAGRPIQLPPPSTEWTRDPAEPEDPLQRTRVSFVGSADDRRRRRCARSSPAPAPTS